MLDEVDAALAALVADVTGEPSAESVSFEAPTTSRENDGNVRLYLVLVDVRETLDGQVSGWHAQHDDRGATVALVPAVRRFEISYLAVANGPTAGDRHRLLGQLVVGLSPLGEIPTEHIGGRLADQGLPVGVRFGEADPPWVVNAGLPVGGVLLVVTVPIVPPEGLEVGPAVSSLELGVQAEPVGPLPPASRPGRDRRWSSYRIKERWSVADEADRP